jgi:nucleoid-associated protein YgaU
MAPGEPIAASPAAPAAQPDAAAVEVDVAEVVEAADGAAVAEVAEVVEAADGAALVEVEEVVVEPEPALPDVAASPPAAAAAQARTHTVKRGETLRVIAEHYYGSRNRADQIYQANRGTLSDPNQIQVGQVLAIP